MFADGVTWDRSLQEDLSEKSPVALDNLDALTSFSSNFPFISFNFTFFFPFLPFPPPFSLSVCLSLSCICLSDVYARENLRLRVNVRGQYIGVGSLLPPCGCWNQAQVVQLGSKHLHLWTTSPSPALRVSSLRSQAGLGPSVLPH